jgi:hypothetical protein
MPALVTNNASGTLAASITAASTTITLNTGQGASFPTPSGSSVFYGTLINSSNEIEIVKVTAKTNDAFTVVRGWDSTTARAYSTGDRFELRPTAALFNSKIDSDTAAATYAPLISPTFTGAPLAPTATAGTNTTQIATTAFVFKAVDDLRTSLGTMSTQNANSVAITGGTISANSVTANGNVVGQNAVGARTIQAVSSGTPSNGTGSNGDIIYQY